MDTNDDKTQLLRPEAGWLLHAADGNLDDIPVTPGKVMTFGRKTECDVVIPSQYISRRHAEVFVEGDQLFVRDLDSTHGTLVNNQAVKQASINDGDEIRMDKAVFVVRRIGPPADDSDKTMIRSVADLEASMDQAVRQEEKAAAEKAAAEKAAAEKAAAEKAAAEKAAAEPQPADSDVEGGGGKQNKNWWDPKEEGVMGTRLLKASDMAAMVESEVAPLVDADGPMLIGLSPAISDLKIALEPGKLIVGKQADADIRLDDGFVSDTHAQIIGEGERWKVVNLISSNGTFVNGNKVQSAYLKSGDVLRFGGLDIQFVTGGRKAEQSGQRIAGKGKRVALVTVTLLVLALLVVVALGYMGKL